jgi:hypothetical protein
LKIFGGYTALILLIKMAKRGNGNGGGASGGGGDPYGAFLGGAIDAK